MALYNLGQMKELTREYLGMTVLDETTTPTENRVVDFINQSTREIMSTYNFRQLEASLRYPFYHTINQVQGAYLTGLAANGSGIQATFVPYPGDGLLNNNTYIDSYVGLDFTGTDILGNVFPGVSTAGSGFYGSVQTIGYQYNLPSGIDTLYGITIPQNSIKLLYVPQYDFDRMLPNTTLTASGTPVYYTQFNGISPNNNIAVQFFPQPDMATFSGTYFTVHYKKTHQDLVINSDTQNVLPEQFQDILLWATLEKTYNFLYQAQDAGRYNAKKLERTEDLIMWASNSLDYVYTARDGNFLGSTMNATMTTPLFRV